MLEIFQDCKKTKNKQNRWCCNYRYNKSFCTKTKKYQLNTDIRNLFDHEIEDYYKPVKSNNFRSNSRNTPSVKKIS